MENLITISHYEIDAGDIYEEVFLQTGIKLVCLYRYKTGSKHSKRYVLAPNNDKPM